MNLILDGLDCPNCGAKIEQATAKLPQVSGATLNFVKQSLIIVSDPKDEGQIEKQVREIVGAIEPGITVHKAEECNRTKKTESLIHGKRLARLAVGAVLLAAAVLNLLTGWMEILLYVSAYLVIGGDVLWTALRNTLRGNLLDENFLMSLATVGAFATRQYPEAVSVMLFYQVGEFFQEYAVNRSRRNISELVDIRPDTATLKTEQGWRQVNPELVRPGDTILIKPGEKVPLDGSILEGGSSLDTSALTGESLPRDVQAGDTLFSGSINLSGTLTVTVTKNYGESTASRILELVENAAAHKAKTENLITRFARIYTPAVVGTAVLLAVIPPLLFGSDWTVWLNRALIFLVVSCPCALVLSIPLSFFGGLGAASKNGILIKGSNYLEALNKVDSVVFDKTGTLTKGVFGVADIHPVNGSQNLLEIAAYAEHFSLHPIATSIRKAYSNPVDETRLSGYHEIAGAGITVMLDDLQLLAGNKELMRQYGVPIQETDESGSVIYLAYDGVYAGWLRIADEIKPDSRSAVLGLKNLGIRHTAMLSGDRLAAAAKVAADLGLDEVRAELLPQDKVEAFREIHQSKKAGSTLFVGDGINDAPVLALADVGVAMGGLGTDAAIEAADVVLMNDEPSKLVQAVKIARFTHRIVWQNILFAMGVKILVLAFGAGGLASLWEAVFADVGVALIAVINATRILRKKY